MKALYDVPAPAKLNLFLHITGRRADGYHLLQSAFMLIDWCDTLHFELRARRRDQPRRPRARPLPRRRPDRARGPGACRRPRGTPLGAHIGVEKRMPAQAGMGGGSSDAASTLLALNRLWSLESDAWSNSRASAWRWAPTCRFSCAGATPGSKALARRSRPLTLPRGRFAGGQAARRTGDAGDFLRPGPQTGQQACYNFRLCCKPVRLWPQRLAACCTEAVPRCTAGP